MIYLSQISSLWPCDLFSFFLTCLMTVTVAPHMLQAACRVRGQIYEVSCPLPSLQGSERWSSGCLACVTSACTNWTTLLTTENFPKRNLSYVASGRLSLAAFRISILSLALRYKCHHWLSFAIGIWDSWWYLENMPSTNLETLKKKTSLYPQKDKQVLCFNKEQINLKLRNKHEFSKTTVLND